MVDFLEKQLKTLNLNANCSDRGYIYLAENVFGEKIVGYSAGENCPFFINDYKIIKHIAINRENVGGDLSSVLKIMSGCKESFKIFF